MPATQTIAAIKTSFEFDGTQCTIARRDSGYMITVFEGGMEIDVSSTDGLGVYERAKDIMDECKKMHRDNGVMPPTPVVLAARARGNWACDRVAYVFSLAAKRIAMGKA